MNEMKVVTPVQPLKGNPVTQLIRAQPLTTYFLFAFLGTWLVFAPAVLSRGFGLFALPDVVAFMLFILSTFTGPMASAILVTHATEGKAGVKALLRRIVQFRVGVGWYLLVIIGYPLLFLVGLIPIAGLSAYAGIGSKLPLFFTGYLPALLLNLFMPGLGEETGWRGFALPRLQRLRGPLLGTLILGSLHAVWHLPAYLVPGFLLPGPFDMTLFLMNSGAILGASFLWTWLFNHARGSIFFAMLFHAASNASAAFVVGLLGGQVNDAPWFVLALFGTVAVLLIVMTRGRLGYQDS